MNPVNVFLGVIAGSAAIVAIVSVVIAFRLLPTIVVLQGVLHRADRTLDRLNGISADLERVTRDVTQMERKVASAVNPLLDLAVPPVRRLAALLSGIRTGWSILARGRAKLPA